MDFQVVKDADNRYIEFLVNGKRIENEQDALDIVALCGEYGVDRILLHGEHFTEDFFNLKTRLAGDILLKFTNYYIKVAAIISPELVNQGRFQEFAIETNRGRDFRIFNDQKKAEEWLVSF